MNDTIAAISTSQGVGAIAIVRVSGPNSIEIVNKIFKGRDLTKVECFEVARGLNEYFGKDKVIPIFVMSRVRPW